MTSDYSGNIPVPGRILHAVLPLAIRGGKEHEDLTRARTLVASLRAGFERSQILNLHIVGRSGELEQIREALAPFACDWLRLDIHDELDVFPELSGSTFNGWVKQQLIKMSVPEWLDCDYWLTLDADVVCVRRFAIEDLLPGGRALARMIPTENAPLYQAWNAASAEVLGYATFDTRRTMDMTPALYSRAIMVGLHRELEKISGVSWRQTLLTSKTLDYRLGHLFAGWTELALYQHFADHHGLWPWHHVVNGIHTDDRLMAEGSIWGEEQIANWSPDWAFSNERPGYFIVCGSHTGVAAQRVHDLVAPFVTAMSNKPRRPVPPPEPASDMGEKPDTTLFLRMIAREPPIYFSVPGFFTPIGIAQQVSPLLSEMPVCFLLGLWWTYETEEHIRPIVDAYRAWQPRYPNHGLIILCNTRAQIDLFGRAGISCVLAPQNMFLDENVFKPDPTQVRRYDAIYNAGITPFKRHLLARDVPSLALIYGNWHGAEVDYVLSVKAALPQALFVNDMVGNGAYASLSPAQCAAWYNQATVGLCLSESEGAMYVSMEYLLCGLPIVSTPSRGGRDHFFDDQIALIVEPDPAAVAEGVRKMVERRLDPQQVRQHVLAKVKAERLKFLSLLEMIFTRMGRPFPGPGIWDSFFTNKLIEPVRAGDVPRYIVHRRSN
jgi:glycosyltransferase involved in cell wall biosynthesis